MSSQGANVSEAAKISKILRAANHFDTLRLPRPTRDLMDQPMWPCTSEDVHRAFRKLSLCCHPDKSSHPDAPRAFEVLKRAKACLGSERERDDYMLEYVKQQKVQWEGSWAAADSAFDEKQRMSSMRQEAQQSEAESIADAMRERRERAEAVERKKRRLQIAQQRRARREAENAEEEAEENEEDEKAESAVHNVTAVSANRPVMGGGRPSGGPTGLHRKRPKFM